MDRAIRYSVLGGQRQASLCLPSRPSLSLRSAGLLDVLRERLPLGAQRRQRAPLLSGDVNPEALQQRCTRVHRGKHSCVLSVPALDHLG